MKCDKYLPELKRLRDYRMSQHRASPGERVLGSLFPNRGSGFPGGWAADRVEQVAHMRHWTYVAVHTICAKIASIMPNMAYVSDASRPGVTTKACRREPGQFGQEQWISDGGHSWLTMGAWRSKALSVVKPHEELEPLESDHPLRRLFENPNPVDTPFDLLYELQMFEELTGQSYLWTIPNAWGKPCEMWVIPSHWVWPRTGGSKYFNPEHPNAENLIHYYEIRPWGGMGSAGTLYFPPEEVVLAKWKSPLNKIDGYSKLSAIAQWIDSEESIAKSRWSQFMNQARPEFWVELGPGYEDPDDDRIKRIEAKFASKLQGEYSYGKPVITPPGAKITPLSFNPTEMAYFSCLDEKTECLTADGWKSYDELTKSTRIACYDPDTNTLVYREPSSIYIKPYEGKMYKWEGERLDALMTPHHRAYVHRPTTYMVGGEIVWKKTPYKHSYRMSKCRVGARVVNADVWDVKRVEELAPKTTYGVLTAAPAACDLPMPVEVDQYTGWRQRDNVDPYSIDPKIWLRFLGYYLSEGCLSCRRVGRGVNGWEIDITQKKRVDSFREGLSKTPFNWSESVDSSNGCTHWKTSNKGLYRYLIGSCGEGALSKRIPGYVKSWPAEYLLVLLNALLEGDGSGPIHHSKGRGGNSKGKNCNPKDDKSSWYAQYYTSSVQLADDVMEIAVKCGLCTSIYCKEDKREEYIGRKRYTVNISSRPEIEVSPSHRSQVDYKGIIWCVTVPTGLFVVRRNGKALITGNSEEQLRDMILSAFGVPKTAVGISQDMTYGSLLAALATFCSQGLNPRLAMRGQSFTKHLGSRWDEMGEGDGYGSIGSGYGTRSTSYGSNVGVGRSGKRLVRIWWDDCLDEETECLTSDGWKRHTELSEDSLILCYDSESQLFYFHKPSRIIVKHYSGPMYRWNTDKIDALMTPNHRAYVLWSPSRPELMEGRRDDSQFRVRLSKDLLEKSTYVAMAYEGYCNDHPLRSAPLHPENRTVEQYTGNVWCVTVPTGLFVVGRNRKAHITGNCVPADPTQLNSDMSEDRASYAITPNEVRAIRGRKPYRFGGDDPLVQGPGGIMPLPINTGEDAGIEELAKLIAPMTQPTPEEGQVNGEEQGAAAAMEGLPGGDQGGEGGVEGLAGLLGSQEEGESENEEEEEPGPIKPAGIANPNGEPRKSFKHNGNGHKASRITFKSNHDSQVRDFESELRSFSDEELDGIRVYYNPGPPELILIDVMDWGDGDVGRKIGKLASRAIGDEARVIRQNEGATPSDKAGWRNLIPFAQEKSSRRGVHKASCKPGQGADLTDCTPLENVSGEATGSSSSIIGTGSTGDIRREGEYVYKPLRPIEGEVYDRLSGVKGISVGEAVGSEVKIPFYKNVISVDTLKPNQRSGVGGIVSRNESRINTAISALSNAGYDYNDPLQFGLDSEKKTNLLDFSNVEKTPVYKALQRNLNYLAIFYETFGSPDSAAAVKDAREMLSGIDSIKSVGVDAADFLDDKYREDAIKFAQELPDGIPSIYYTRNAREVGISGALQTTNRDKIKLVISAVPLSEKDVQQWELKPIYEGVNNSVPEKKKSLKTNKRVVVRKSPSRHPYTIAVDLDGTLAEYDGWQGEEHFGEPREGAREAMQALRDQGCQIIIFTTRGRTDLVQAWLESNSIPFDHINENPDQPDGTSSKVVADVYLDDRAVDASRDWSTILQEVVTRLEDEGDKEESNKKGHEFSSTQFNLPPKTARRIQEMSSRILDEDLAADGREEIPHITVLYGLHTDNPEDIRSLIEDFGPVRVTLGKTSLFPTEETSTQRGGDSFDVVKIDVDSEDLHSLNQLLSDNLKHTDTHPIYQPHVTLAYVKPGEGEKYVMDDSVEGTELVFDELVFSSKGGTKTTISLVGNQEEIEDRR